MFSSHQLFRARHLYQILLCNVFNYVDILSEFFSGIVIFTQILDVNVIARNRYFVQSLTGPIVAYGILDLGQQ